MVALQQAGGAASVRVVPTFSEVLALPEAPSVIAVDIPIGLLDAAVPGGRPPDPAARKLLGTGRGSSVFSPPVRGALESMTFQEAGAANRASSSHTIGISLQAFGLFPKLLEVDRAMTAETQGRVLEVHPELSFFEMAGGVPARHAKKTLSGRAERIALLAGAGLAHRGGKLAGAAPDDILDALAACWTARRIAVGQAIRVPRDAPVDLRGLRMEIWR